MVTKGQKKLIQSLQRKKIRKQQGLFVAEGKKVIRELLDAQMVLHSLFTADTDIFTVHEAGDLVVRISEQELQQISFLNTPQVALAIFHIPELLTPVSTTDLILALDDVRDPGNLGTIIRLCDWFGIPNLVCSSSTVDCYNPKVVQATMGSITRVAVRYMDLEEFLETLDSKVPVFGTFMEGAAVYNEALPKNGVVVMGNEAHGISDGISRKIQQRITIPHYGMQQETESLNVATATAIILHEFRRG